MQLIVSSRPKICNSRLHLGVMSLDDLAAAHAALDRAVRTLYADRARLIQRARADGHTWQAIADVLGMTVHGAIKASRMD